MEAIIVLVISILAGIIAIPVISIFSYIRVGKIDKKVKILEEELARLKQTSQQNFAQNQLSNSINAQNLSHTQPTVNLNEIKSAELANSQDQLLKTQLTKTSQSENHSLTSQQQPDSSTREPAGINLSAEKNQPKFENQSTSIESIFSWFLKDWYLKLGAGLVLLAVVWFVTLAFMNNWIGPTGRIALGFVFGLVGMAFAQYWNVKNTTQATILHGLSAGIVLATMYAARNIYSMFTPELALFFLVVVVGTLGFSSALANLQSRAVLGVIMASIVPFLVNAQSGSVAGLLQYVLALSIVAGGLILWKKWEFLLITNLLIILFFAIPIGMHKIDLKLNIQENQDSLEQMLESRQRNLSNIQKARNTGYQLDYIELSDNGNYREPLVDYSADIQNLEKRISQLTADYEKDLTQIRVIYGLLTLLLLGVSTFLIYLEKRLSALQIILLSLVTAFSVFWTFALVPENWQSIVMLGMASLISALGLLVLRQFAKPEQLAFIWMLATALVGVAAVFELEGPVLAITGILLIASYVLGMSWLLKSSSSSKSLGFLHFLSTIFMIPYLFGDWHEPNEMWQSWLVIGAYMISLFLMTVFWKYVWEPGLSGEKYRWLSWYYLSLLVVGLIWYARFCDWLFPSNEALARGVVLITFAIMGIVYYLIGKIHRGPIMKGVGVVMVVGVTAWLLLVETGEMDLTARIITFAVVGLLFIAVALGERKLFAGLEKKLEDR